MATTRLPIDEDPLRQWILKGYHERRDEPGETKAILALVRQFLSGPPGGDVLTNRYWFQEDPPSSVARFLRDLDAFRPGLARHVLDALLTAVREREEAAARELAPKLAVYVASLAGAVAVKAGVDETLACVLLSAALLGIARVGRELFEEELRSLPGPQPDRPT